MNECGCAPIKLYLYALEAEFPVILVCHEILFFLWFWFSAIHKSKNHLCSQGKANSWLGFFFIEQVIIERLHVPSTVLSGRNAIVNKEKKLPAPTELTF